MAKTRKYYFRPMRPFKVLAEKVPWNSQTMLVGRETNLGQNRLVNQAAER
jgi:hypothetical protein